MPIRYFIFPDAAGGGNTIAVPAGALTLTGYAPTVTATNHQTVAVPSGSLTLTGYAPTVSVSANQAIQVPVGALTLTAHAPTVAVSDHKTIAVPAGQLTLTGYAPEVKSGINVAVPAGQLTLTGYAPTVVATAHQTVSVPKGALVLTGYAPTVSNGDRGGMLFRSRPSRRVLVRVHGARYQVPEEDLEYWLERQEDELVAEASQPVTVERRKGKARLIVKPREPATIKVQTDDSWVRSIVVQANQRIAERVQMERAARQAEEEDEELTLLMI